MRESPNEREGEIEIERERGSARERERDSERVRVGEGGRRDAFAQSRGRRDSCATHSNIRLRLNQTFARIRAAGAGDDARLIQTFARRRECE